MTEFSLSDLEKIVDERASASPDQSYTAKLKAKGVGHVSKKLGEESIETVIALVSEDETRIVSESADLLYHLLVALNLRGVPVADVMAELGKRTATGGLAEKASRVSGPAHG